MLAASCSPSSAHYLSCAPNPQSERHRAQYGVFGDISIDLGNEYTDYAKPRGGKGGKAGSRSSSQSSSFTRAALLYIPNRIFDLFDIFRLDVGIGPSWGISGRITKWGQAGYREFHPWSGRFGIRGRNSPFFVERGRSVGVGTGYREARERVVTPGEIGLGLDALIVGAYAGLSLDELGDFITGIVGIDLGDDDLD